jgi:hypothetical protein
MSDSRTKFKSYFVENAVSMEFFELMVGEHIGTGAFRSVFHLAPNPNLVIKFEQGADTFHNVQEWEIWKRVKKDKELSKWFAPCQSISFGGSVLIQRYARDCLDTELPTLIPTLFTDNAPRNWGKIGNQAVCRDYGLHTMYERGLSKALRHVEWSLKGTKVKVV